MEFIRKNKTDQIINTMIGFFDDAIASDIWGDIDYAVIKPSTNVWEARLKLLVGVLPRKKNWK